MNDNLIRLPSSYRDPSGFLFRYRDQLYRQVNKVYAEDLERLHSSGLYEALVEKELFLPYARVKQNLTGSGDWYETLQPEPIPFISYPYEWCFRMWQDAALATLALAREAMKHGMMLKDASAYNLQWHGGKMKLIDHLSFERYEEHRPWIAYRQFCEHFLAPLALMHYRQLPLQPLFIAYPDGIPLGMAKQLLPFRSRLHLHTALHLHLHAAAGKKKETGFRESGGFSPRKMEHLLQSLEEAVRSYSFDRPSGVWSEYYEEAGQREAYLADKKELVAGWIRQVNKSSAIDLGANEGAFSLLLAEEKMRVISADQDHYAINKLYRQVRGRKDIDLHPIVLDLVHPSPALGLNNTEREAFTGRASGDLVLALALMHHLCIGKNVPFEELARLLHSLGPLLIIEFIPKEDEKVRYMLQQKKDVYDGYSREKFLAVFSTRYRILAQQPVAGSDRILYLMQSHAD